MNSERFPGKPLALIAGRSMILRTVERAEQSQRAHKVLVATDSPEIQTVLQQHEKEVVLTGHCASGTDRVAEAAQFLPHRYGVVVNVQGDEPLVAPEHIDMLVQHLEASAESSMATLATPIDDQADFLNPNVVKTVLDASGHALLFSRAPIPYAPGGFPEILERRGRGFPGALRHVGLYAFRRSLLAQWRSLPASPLQLLEDLEQVRALEHGVKIKVLVAGESAPDVNVPGDVQRVEEYLRRRRPAAPEAAA